MKYKFIDDLTSDVMFEAYGKDLNELFINAAEALFSVICKIDKVESKEKRNIILEMPSVEELMISWLQELIALVDTEEMFFNKFDVKIEQKENIYSLNATIHGESISQEKGETVVKAVTYYKYKLEKTKDGYKVMISLDI